MAKNKSGFGKLLAALGLGAGIGMLLAPKSGEELRKGLKVKINDFIDEVKNIDIQEAKDDFLTKLDEIKLEIEELDKEKVLEIAKEKSEVLKAKTEELICLAKEKGTPVLESTAEGIRLKAIEVTKDVLKKLENKN